MITLNAEKFLELSDEEVLVDSLDTSELDEKDENIEDVEDDNQHPRKRTKYAPYPSKASISGSEASTRPEDNEDVGGWGSSKRDYYNADAIETEADALEEEAEARRLQRKQLQGLTEEDFGFDEVEWAEAGKGDADGGDVIGQGNTVREVLPELEITDAMSSAERLKIMRARYPEFEPLAKEFVQLQATHKDLGLASEAAVAFQRLQVKADGSNLASDLDNTPIAMTKSNALGAYLAALCIYFALLTSKAGDANGKITAMSPVELRDHTVMETLIKCRELWDRVKDIPVPDPSNLINHKASLLTKTTHEESTPEMKNDIAMEDANNEMHQDKGRKPRMTKAQKAALAVQAEEKARRLERIKKTEEDLLSLSVLTDPSRMHRHSQTRRHSRSGSPLSNSSFGEQSALTPKEALEKATSKRSLRFYTSQIAQKSQKRGAAGRHAGGDDDIPHRERLRDRQERLNVAAEKRGNKKINSKNSLGDDSNDEDHQAAADLRGRDEDQDYYDLVAARSAQKKANKSALAAQAQTANTALAPIENEQVGAPDGKRAITYAISKNKGLAPRRKKDVRNPRVKKRKKFEEKKKKLGSTRAVFKGGEGRGGYGGELTGIKKNLVRGVKL